MSTLSLDDFSALRGEVFETAAGDGSLLPLRLVTAEPLAMPAAHGRQPFSLMFEGPPQPLLPQRIVRLDRAAADALDIFLVPVGCDARAARYQAIFT